MPMPTTAPSRPATPGRGGGSGGVWEPLPSIIYGYAVHPLSPSHRDTRISSRPRLSTVTEVSTAESFIHRDVVALEVGDEVYAFEKYTPRGKETEGVWYRGYVVCTTRRPPVSWNVSSDPSSSRGPRLEEPQQVFIGIFPGSHIFIREELPDAEGSLADVAAAFQNGTRHAGADGSKPRTPGPRGEDEEEDLTAMRKSFKLGPPPDQANSSRAGLPVYPASVRSLSPTGSHNMKPLPPRPSLKSNDETVSGTAQPIVDEIASALREWHMLMFQYLARRDYQLFQTVREHIEALHLGRRQLLSQTLSNEETANLRRDCVARLVSGNIVQNLDVIVRHPNGGGLVTVDIEGEIDTRNWMSAVRMYALQASLAYSDGSSDGSKALKSRQSLDIFSTSPVPTPAHSASQIWSLKVFLFGWHLVLSNTLRRVIAQILSCHLELRAFVASPCTPGETAELYFSLYNKGDARFVTEDFCVVLNHNGVLARDPSARIRTLFTDLAPTDIQGTIFLVCRIVRNGSVKIGPNPSSGIPIDNGQRGSNPSGWNTSPTEIALGTNLPIVTAASDGSATFRRPFGCAVLELSQLNRVILDPAEVSSTKEHAMPIFTPVNEATFSMLHQDIINSNSKEFEKSPSRVDEDFHGNAKTIVKENSSLLLDAPLTLRLGFPDVVFPGEDRNELYIKLWSGDFPSAHSNSARRSVSPFVRGSGTFTTSNIQVTIEVRDTLGKTVENVISQGSGESNVSQFHSLVFLRNSQPTFGELIKLALPWNELPRWHLFFTFRYRSSRDRTAKILGGETGDKPFAFAFLPLFPDGRAFLEDGSHTLVLYRADRLNQITQDVYLGATPLLLSGQRSDQLTIPAELQRIAPPIRDALIIRSSLCSTRHTQNPVLSRLLNWHQIDEKELLSAVLVKFTFVGEVEIVKFLRDIFDSLFAILASPINQAGEMDHLVFNALVTVLGIVQDRRFSNFQPVLDIYIQQHFNCASASSHIINSMNRMLADPTRNDTASPLRAAFKVWHYIFKFIVRSRALQKTREASVGGGATAEHLESTFRRDLRSHLSEVNKVMTTTSPLSIIGTQTIALQRFTSILPELAQIFSTVEVVSIATAFANTISSAKGKLAVWKLVMFLQLVKGFLFDNAQSRALLVEAVVMWIKPYFGRFDEYTMTQPGDDENAIDAARVSWLESIRLCVTIIALMLDKLQQKLVDPEILADRNSLRQEQDNVDYLLSLLPRLLDSYRELQSTANAHAVERKRTPATSPSTTLVTFPESYPFSLIAQLPRVPKGFNGVYQAEGQILFSPAQGETAIVLLVIILSSPKKYLLSFFEGVFEIEGRDNFASLLLQLFRVANSMLDNEAWPTNWLNVNIMAHRVLVKMMDAVAALLERRFIPTDDATFAFNTELWRGAFQVLLKLLSSDQLVIEEFSPQRRRAVWRMAGDIRGEGAAILQQLWDALGWPEEVSEQAGVVTRYGGYQKSLSSLVSHVVNLCVSHHDLLRSTAVQILYSMIVSQYHEHQHFDDIEHELISKLDSLFMSDSKADDLSRAFFISQLRHLFESSNVEEHLRERVSNFLDSVDLFLEMLLSVRALPEGEEFSDDRVIATLRLMNFIRRIGRNEIYIKYVHQLVNVSVVLSPPIALICSPSQMHLQSQNYVEAALTLKLHADLHEWDLNSFVEPMEDLGLPQQSQFHRKETLHLLILDYLGKGKAWESAIEICKELAYQHSEVTFNYGRLAEIMRHQAALLEHIITDQRYYPDYFRVAFYGNFPVAIRNKQFIYRGFEWEKYGAFCERMLAKHTGAQLLRTLGDPPVDIRFGNDQYIQCSAVTSEPNRDLPIFTNPDVPVAVRTYYEHCAINYFSSSRTIAKVDRDRNEDPWVEKTYFTTEESFPAVLRRSEVVAVEVVEMSPVENALLEVEQKNKELSALNLKYSMLAKTAQIVSTNPLSMALNNVVDAPASGGIASYRTSFLAPDYVTRYPDRTEFVEKLRDAVDQQIRIIESCLRLHGQLCPPEMLAFHETLEKFFRKNFNEEIQRLSFEFPTEREIDSSLRQPDASYAPSLTDVTSIIPSGSSASTTRAHFAIPPLNLPGPHITPPQSPVATLAGTATQPTRLQKHIAHLARHGMNAVSSGPGEGIDTSVPRSDTLSVGSPQGSFVNVTGTAGPSAANSGTSLIGSKSGSLKGRFSRFGSLSFVRRDGNGS
ncbi:C2 domain in Dock180 and Zizimin proteins-domain-containing protein [Multifurca ochricompacta]|uniref:C2 domain in Dock180 and Zizimin proteins-domain-containing protein n=1 Tax=Multifurca ochricompacta TaxID=376703 RepID=A0AAD4M9B6_9AGAM|nr:C2 domain in Dock180 and Zizimin proteins-domain-containing protein [Multifurca ochricompacta]